MELQKSDTLSATDVFRHSGVTPENQVAQLLRLPGRSGAALSPSSASTYMNSIQMQPMTMYSNQVGGHRVLVKPKDSSVVLKPYDEAEFNFYDQCMPVVCSCLMPFTARCYGEVDLRSADHLSSSSGAPGKSGKYVMLEDLAHGIKKPCILDLKMGLKQRSVRNFSEKKLQSKAYKSLTTTSHELGFRLGGAQHTSDEGVTTLYNKYFGRLQDAAGTYKILRIVFGSVSSDACRVMIIEMFIKKLLELRSVIRGLKGFRFWSGSLLFVFDSAVDAIVSPDSVILKMIDFANYTRLEDSCFDKEYDFGIDCLIKFLQGTLNGDAIDVVLSRLGQPPDPHVQDQELMTAHIKNFIH